MDPNKILGRLEYSRNPNTLPTHMPRNILFAVASVLLLGIGGWYVYTNIISPDDNTHAAADKSTGQTTVVNESTNTASTVVGDSTSPEVGTVFGQEIDPEAYAATVEMLGTLSEDTLARLAHEIERDEATPELISLYAHSLPLIVQHSLAMMNKESTVSHDAAVTQLKEKFNDDAKQQILGQLGLDEKYWDTYLDMSARFMRKSEFSSAVDKTRQETFDPLIDTAVSEIHDAFAAQLAHMSEADKLSLRNYTANTPIVTRIGDLFPMADDAYLLNTLDDTPVTSLAMPAGLQSFFQSHQSEPYALSDVFQQGDYWYLGFVVAQSTTVDLAPGFTRDDVLIVRFPSYELSYDTTVLSLLWQRGIEDGDINYTGLDPTVISGNDEDNDGLPWYVERALGTSDNYADSDNDGYDDATEYKNGFNPSGV